MLKEIHAALADGEQATLMIQRSGDQAVVTIVPRVGASNDGNASEAEKALRAALALPMRIKDTPETLDATLVQQLREYAELRHQVAAESETLRGLREAALMAKQEAAKAQANAKADARKGSADGKEAKASAEETDTSDGDGGKAATEATQQAAPAPAPAADNPDSLF